MQHLTNFIVQLFAPYFLSMYCVKMTFLIKSTISEENNAILTCQLAIALHMKTSEFKAPEGFARTWEHRDHQKGSITVQPEEEWWKQVHTIAHRPRKASSFSISSRILPRINPNNLSCDDTIDHEINKPVSHWNRWKITYVDKAMHHDCIKCSICGDTSSGQTHASLPSVIALFSIRDLFSSCLPTRCAITNIIKPLLLHSFTFTSWQTHK